MALSDDSAALDPLWNTFLQRLLDSATADVALQTAVETVVAARSDHVQKRNDARVALGDFLRRLGTGSMTVQQRQAFRRVFGEVNDLDPAQLAGLVRRAAEGGD